MNNRVRDGTSRWVRYIKSRLRRNKNFLGVFIGQTGSGKSYSAISLADLIQDLKLPKENICFKAKDFITRLDTGIKDGTLPRGSVLVWDEAGIELNAKKWQSLTNRIISSIMQVFRHENIIVLFTVPYLSFIDSDTRKLIHAFFQTEKIDKNKKLCIVKPFNIQVNQITGKMYRKSLKVKLDNGQYIKVKHIALSMPREELRIYYEQIATAFKRDVISNAKIEIEQVEATKALKIKSAAHPLTTRQGEVIALVEQGYSVEEIAKAMGITKTGVYNSLIAIKSKGIDVKIAKNHKENPPPTSESIEKQIPNLIR